MSTFIILSRHSPENCPMFNEKVRKVALELMGKIEELAKKHGVKMIGGWNVHCEHLMVAVFEASSEAFNKFGMEPEIAAWDAYNTTEWKIAVSLEEVTKMLMQAK